MAHQTVFAMCAYNAKSGVVVDLGERMDVVPVVDGYKVSSGSFFTTQTFLKIKICVRSLNGN